jgi:predicted RNase H-like HicB family nuclease
MRMSSHGGIALTMAAQTPVCYNTGTHFGEEKAVMTVYVLIENKPEGRYTASLISWPDIRAQGETEDEALSQLRQSFTAHMRHARIVPLDLDLATAEKPWLEMAGIFRDDPFSTEFEELIAAYRRELDTQDESA